jgi:hypothetical protein
MIKALKLTMALYAVSGILLGLAFIAIPRQLGTILGYESGPTFIAALTAMLGASFVSACIFLLIAARDPIKHLLWVKYAILFAILSLFAPLYSVLLGNITIVQALVPIITHTVFGIALLTFYPWHMVQHKD